MVGLLPALGVLLAAIAMTTVSGKSCKGCLAGQLVQVQYGAYGAYMAGVPLPSHAAWNPKSSRQQDFELLLSKPAFDIVEQWASKSDLLLEAAGHVVVRNGTQSIASPANYIRLLSRLVAGGCVAANLQGTTREERERLEMERFDSTFMLDQLERVSAKSSFNDLISVRYAIDLVPRALKHGLSVSNNKNMTVWERALVIRSSLLLPPGLALDRESLAKQHLDLQDDFLRTSLGFLVMPDYADLVANRLVQVYRMYPMLAIGYLDGVVSPKRHLTRALLKAIDLHGDTHALLRMFKEVSAEGGKRLLQSLLSDYCFVNNDMYDAVLPQAHYLVHAPVPATTVASPWEAECVMAANRVLNVKLWPHRSVIELVGGEGNGTSLTVFQIRSDDQDRVRDVVDQRTITYAIDDIYVIPLRGVQLSKAVVMYANEQAKRASCREEQVLQLAALLPDTHVMVVRQAPASN